MTTRTARSFAATAALAVLLLTGCSSGSDSMDSADGGGTDDSAASSVEAPAEAMPEGGAENGPEAPAADGARSVAEDSDAADSGTTSAAGGDEESADPVDPADGFRRAVIRTGDLSMRADDVGQARFQVQRIADRYQGEVTEENTESGDDGETAYARMVLRVPSEDFDEVVAALEEVGEKTTVSTSADDVTTKLIDLQTRVESQRRSIQRITVLFEQAKTIRDVMSIESELSWRQAELESLERKRAFLAGQASMSTITVGIERTPEKRAAAAKADDDDGFLAGLTAGWGALRDFGTGAATVVGALLPWAVVLALLGVPVLLVVRRRAPRPQASE